MGPTNIPVVKFKQEESMTRGVRIRAVALGIVALVMALAFSPMPAQAALLTDTAIDSAGFGGFAGAAVVAALVSVFDYAPATPG
jgi:hypothetical protein